MKSYEVLRQAFKLVGCKNVAVELGCSLSLVHQWSRGQDGRSEARNPLDLLLRCLQITGDRRLLEWLCKQAGGRFVHGQELRSLICQDCEQLITKLEGVMRAGDGNKPTGARSWKLAEREEVISRGRCRWRLPNGRCGRK
jgi:hypothetical protein